MWETRRNYAPEFGEGAVRIVRKTGKPIAVLTRDLGINRGCLGNCGDKDRIERGRLPQVTRNSGQLPVSGEAQLPKEPEL